LSKFINIKCDGLVLLIKSFLAISNMRWFANFFGALMHVSLTKQQGLTAHTQPACTTVDSIFWCAPAELCWCESFAGVTFSSKTAPAKFKMRQQNH
jgi:hypothetical protein